MAFRQSLRVAARGASALRTPLSAIRVQARCLSRKSVVSANAVSPASAAAAASSSSSSDVSEQDGGSEDGEPGMYEGQNPGDPFQTWAKVGMFAPDASGKAVVGGEIVDFSLHDSTTEGDGKRWHILLFYPKDFTFVCPTELIAFSDRNADFEKLNCKVVGVSTDTENAHLAWIRMSRKKGGLGHIAFPMLADPTHHVSREYGVLIDAEGIALRGLFLIDPKGVLRHSVVNDLPVGRSVDEALRVLQAFQYVEEHGDEVCPANWAPGAKTMHPHPDDSLEYFADVPEAGAEADQGNVVAVRDRKHYEELLKGKGATVVDFMAPWCGKCTMIGPFFSELSKKVPDAKFLKFDTTEDSLGELKEELKVKALPTFRFYKDGKEVLEEVVGYKKKGLLERVQKLVGGAKAVKA